MGGAMECQPRQASSSSLGSVLVLRILLRSSRSRHLLGAEQYLPRPYMPSIFDAISVSSCDSFGSDGAARVSESRSSLNSRASASGILRLLKRVDSLASCMVAAICCSSALAASISVSPVMKVDFTQSARAPWMVRSRSLASARSMKPRASARVGGFWASAAWHVQKVMARTIMKKRTLQLSWMRMSWSAQAVVLRRGGLLDQRGAVAIGGGGSPEFVLMDLDRGRALFAPYDAASSH
jgi:hypothetical protein